MAGFVFLRCVIALNAAFVELAQCFVRVAQPFFLFVVTLQPEIAIKPQNVWK